MKFGLIKNLVQRYKLSLKLTRLQDRRISILFQADKFRFFITSISAKYRFTTQ